MERRGVFMLEFFYNFSRTCGSRVLSAKIYRGRGCFFKDAFCSFRDFRLFVERSMERVMRERARRGIVYERSRGDVVRLESVK